MNTDACIAEILLYHDRVVIPSFGIIISEQRSAAIHPAEHSFEPPKNVFSFSPVPGENDHVLSGMISQANGINETEAMQVIHRFTEDIEKGLREKGAYDLKGIGKFYFDIEKKLQFASLPDKNYLLSSFGLPEFISKPVLHPENIPTYSTRSKQPEKKRRRFIWFRF